MIMMIIIKWLFYAQSTVCVCVCVCVFHHASYIQPLWLYHGIRYESQAEECSLETRKFGAVYDKRQVCAQIQRMIDAVTFDEA